MKGIYLLLLFTLIVSSNASYLGKDILEANLDKPTKEIFKIYHFAYARAYALDSEEGLARYKIFKDNLKYIKEENSKNLSYKLGFGPFTDHTFEEFAGVKSIEEYKVTDEKILNHIKEKEESQKLGRSNRKKKSLNDIWMRDYFDDKDNWYENHDWSSLFNKIPIGRVKHGEDDFRAYRCYTDQLYTLINMGFEAHMKTRNLPHAKLSKQSYFDCFTRYENQYGKKCDVSSTPPIFSYEYLDFAGLYTLENYPEFRDVEDVGECQERIQPYDYSSKTTRCSALNGPCTIKIKKEMISLGPVMTAVEIGKSLQHYSSGVYDSKSCDKLELYTQALLVKVEKDLVKLVFPFGKTFGEGGFARFSREFSGRYVANKYYRVIKSCGAETSWQIPYKLTYLWDNAAYRKKYESKRKQL